MAETYRIQITFAWWVKWHCRSVALFCALTGMEPDMAKLEAKIRRGMRTSVVAAPSSKSNGSPPAGGGAQHRQPST